MGVRLLDDDALDALREGEQLGPEELLLAAFPGVRAFFRTSPCSSSAGVLFLSSKRVLWTTESRARGFELPYLDISLHAVSRQRSPLFPFPCLFLQLSQGQEEGQEEEDDDEEDVEEEDDEKEQEAKGGHKQKQDDDAFCLPLSPVSELRFVPAQEEQLEQLFSKMSEGQSMNPDPEEEQNSGLAGGFFDFGSMVTAADFAGQEEEEEEEEGEEGDAILLGGQAEDGEEDQREARGESHKRKAPSSSSSSSS